MKNKTKKITKKVGRPKIQLNLSELQKLCRLNCTMPEIAAFFDVPLRTLEDKYTNDENVRNAIDKGRNEGKLSLRRKQIQIMDETNNPTMAIWLGKQLLGQKDRQEILQDVHIEERKVLDLTKITDEDLNIIERALKYAVVEPSESRKNEALPKIIHQRSMANN
tara:strand:- start:37 stop:528 length:492 start_codon:yes stop_codon:yes gene_type:complete